MKPAEASVCDPRIDGRSRLLLARLLLSAALLSGSFLPANSAQQIAAGAPAAPQVTLASLQQPRGDDAATERLLKSLRRQPRPGAAFDRLVQQLEQSGKLADSIARLRADMQSAPPDDDGSTAVILGLFELHAHRRDSARTALTAAARLRPRDPVVFWLLGSVTLQLGDSAVAIDALETALALKPSAADLPGIARDLTTALRGAGRSSEIATVWTRAEALDPDNLRLCEQAAVALRNAELPQQALTRFQRLAKELQDPWRRNQARLAVADVKRRLGQAQQALADEEAILDDLDPDSWQTRQLLDRIEDGLLQAGRADDLQKLLNQRLERSGYEAELVRRLVRLLRLRNRDADALQLLERLLPAAPQDRSLRLLLIAEYTRSGRPASAIAQYEQLEASGLLRPEDREAWGRLLLAGAGKAESSSSAERARQAAVIWRGGLTDPPSAGELRRVAALLRGAGLVADAIPLLEQAVSLDSADAAAREQLGSCLHAVGRRDDALREWRGLAAGDRRSPEAFRELSVILRAHGEHRAAIEALTEACDVLPTVSDLLRLASAQAEFREGTTRPLLADSLAVLKHAAATAETFTDWQRVVEQQAATLQQQGQLEAVLRQLRDASAVSAAGPPEAELPAAELSLPPRLLSQLHLALLERAAGNFERALLEVRQTLAAATADPAVLRLAAELSAAAGLPAAAMELHEQLLQHDLRGRVTHLAALMKLCLQQGLRDRAGEYARRLLQAAPEDPVMLTAAAEVLIECGESDTAVAALEAALRRQPEDSATALALASLLAAQNQIGRALDVCRSALEHAVDDRARTELARLLAELHQQLDSPPETLQWLEDRIAEADDLQRGSWLRTLAEIHKVSGQTALASRALERSLQLDGPDTAVLLDLSELALRRQDSAAAVTMLEQISAAELEPAEARRLLDLALRSGSAGVVVLRTSAALPRLETADHISLLDRLLQQRRFRDAEVVAEQVLNSGREAWEVRLRLAVAQSRSGRVVAATATCRQLLQISLPLRTPSADAVRARPGKASLRLPAGVHAASPEAWDEAFENSTRIFLDLSPQRDPEVFSEGWCESFAVARLLAVTGLLLAEDQSATANAPQSQAPPPVSARPAWDAWVRSQLRAVAQRLPNWSLSTALQLADEGDAGAGADADPGADADAAVLSTAIQLFAPVGSRPLVDADGRWLGIQWRRVSERRRQRVQRPDSRKIAGIQASFRNAAARGDLELCERSAPAVAAACQHGEQPAAARQLLEHLQRETATPAELLVAIFLQQALSEYSPSAAFSVESRLPMLNRVLSATISPLQRSSPEVRARALQLPAEWLQQLPADELTVVNRQLICDWWLNQPEDSNPGAAMADADFSSISGPGTPPGSLEPSAASAEATFQSRCGQLLQALLPEDERLLLRLLVKQAPREAQQVAESSAAVARQPLRATVLRAAVANEAADSANLLTATEQLLTLRPQHPVVVLLAADCRQRAGMFAKATELLLQLPPGLPALSRQRSFRLLELAALQRDTAALDTAALELAGMELSGTERSQLLSMLRICGTPGLLLDLQQRQSPVNVAASSASGVRQQIQQLQRLEQTGDAAAAAPLARQVIISGTGLGQGGVRFRRQPDAAAVALRERAWDVLRRTGELDRWIEQQQSSLRGAPESESVRRQLTEALQAAGRTAEAAEIRAAAVQPAMSAASSEAADIAPQKSLRHIPDFVPVPGNAPDWLGTTWPACGPLPVRVIQGRLLAAFQAVSSENPEDGFEQLLGIEEQDATRAAAWLARQTPSADPISLSALQRLAVSALTAGGIQRLTARRLQLLREDADPGPSWTGTRGLPGASVLAATARRGPRDIPALRQQLTDVQNLAPEDKVLIEVLAILIAD